MGGTPGGVPKDDGGGGAPNPPGGGGGMAVKPLPDGGNIPIGGGGIIPFILIGGGAPNIPMGLDICPYLGAS